MGVAHEGVEVVEPPARTVVLAAGPTVDRRQVVGPDVGLAGGHGAATSASPEGAAAAAAPPDRLARPADRAGRRHLGHDLLGQDVERRHRRGHRVEPSLHHGRQQRRALDQLVAGEREQAALGHAPQAVVGPAHPLEERGDAARRADLAHQLDRADVDAQLERRRGHERPQVARPQPRLDLVAAVLGERSVVGGHHVVAQLLAELVGEPLGQPAGVDEHEGRVVLAHQVGDAVDHVAHLLGRGHGLELALGQLERQVELPLVAGVDDGARRGGAGAGQQVGHERDRPLRGRQAHPLGSGRTGVLDPFQRERQVRAALVAGHGVDLVDDDRVDAAPAWCGCGPR